MDEDNKPEQEYINEDGSRPHVSVFGIDMDKGAGASSSQSGDSSAGATNAAGATTKEDWRARKEEWKTQHRAQREQWKAQRHNWGPGGPGHHDGGGFFAGLLILFIGVIALLYTMGYASSVFWHAILPFWPVLLILWGMSIILGRHWSTRIILFIITLVFLVAVVIYGLVKVDSPLVSSLPPNVTTSINNIQPAQQ